jgi:hypothetical protein
LIWSPVRTGKIVWPIPNKGLKKHPPDGGADLDHLGNADQVIAPDYAHEFAHGARVERIGRAGHLPHIERPNQVSRVVRDFIGG